MIGSFGLIHYLNKIQEVVREEVVLKIQAPVKSPS